MAERSGDFNILTGTIPVMDFQSFQSKQAMKARKEKPRNGDMTGYSEGCTVGYRNNTLKRRQFQSRDWLGVCFKSGSGAS